MEPYPECVQNSIVFYDAAFPSWKARMFVSKGRPELPISGGPARLTQSATPHEMRANERSSL